MPTINHFVAPQDGWISIASNTSFLRVTTYPENHPYYLWSGPTIPTSVSQIGARLQCGEFFETVSNSDTFWVRTVNPVSGSRLNNGKLRFDIMYGAASTGSNALLLENGSFLLLEDGTSKLLLG